MPPAPVSDTLKHFLQAEKFAVIGRTMNDRSRWDNKILRWYQDRKFPVVGVRPNKPSEVVEGIELLTDPNQIPDLSKTSISIIINPLIGLQILKTLFPYPKPPSDSGSVEPRSVWFQPGADNSEIWEFVQKRGLEGKVIGKGECVYRDGDSILRQIQKDQGESKL